jgi:hypothetical protein
VPERVHAVFWLAVRVEHPGHLLMARSTSGAARTRKRSYSWLGRTAAASCRGPGRRLGGTRGGADHPSRDNSHASTRPGSGGLRR